jgi:hypothetical protein
MMAARKRRFADVKPGVVATYLRDNYKFDQGQGLVTVKNGHILYLYTTLSRDIQSTTKQLQSLITAPQGESHSYEVTRLVTKFKLFKRPSNPNEFHRLKDIFETEFVINPKPVKKSTCAPSSTPIKPAGSPLKTRNMKLCSNCHLLTKHLRQCLLDKTELKRKIRSNTGGQSVKRLNEKIKRKDRRIMELKRLLKEKHKSCTKQRSLKRKQLYHNKVKTEIREKKLGLAQQKKYIEKQTRHQVQTLEDELGQLQQQLEDMHSDNANTGYEKGGKSYPFKTRMLVYDCLMSHVPTEKVQEHIQSFSKRLGVEIEAPSRTTVEAMALELGVLTDLHAAKLVLTNECTIGFDATTQEGKHLNSIHVTTETKCMVLSIEELAGGTADDYAQHILQTVEHLVSVYVYFNPDSDFKETKKSMIKNIKNTMTDRAAANHAAIRTVNEILGIELNELNCHLHPLDTIANKSKTCLSRLENGKPCPSLFGNGCLAERIILALNKMRYKDGKGDPHGFRVFLQDYNIPKGLIIRYRGNRLHVLFRLASTYITHYGLILKYLTTRCLNNTSLKTALIAALQDPLGLAILELKCLGILGKVLTGPWMSRYYSNDVNHVDAFVEIKCCLERIEAFIAHGVVVLDDLKIDFFGTELTDRDKELFKDNIDKEQFTTMFISMLQAVVEVLRRQYKRYLCWQDEQYDELRATLSTARTHNIDAEEIMGMYSAAVARAPNSCTMYQSAVIRATKNKTLQHLDEMDETEREQIINKAVPYAAKLKKTDKTKVKELQTELSKRIATKTQKKTQTERKRFEKQVKDIMEGDKVQDNEIKDAFPDYDFDVAMIRDIMENKVSGKEVVHYWTEDGSFVPTAYMGKIEKRKKLKGKTFFVICYWSDMEGETYDEHGTDFNIDAHELVADFISGDLHFV